MWTEEKEAFHNSPAKCYSYSWQSIDTHLGRGIKTFILMKCNMIIIYTFSVLRAHCDWNPPVTGGFPSQRPVTRSFDVFCDLRLNKLLCKQSRHRWFETPSWSLWRHRNGANEACIKTSVTYNRTKIEWNSTNANCVPNVGDALYDNDWKEIVLFDSSTCKYEGSTRLTLGRQKTLGHLWSMNPNMIIHFANQSQNCHLLKISKNIFIQTFHDYKLWKVVQSISDWTNIENPCRSPRTSYIWTCRVLGITF